MADNYSSSTFLQKNVNIAQGVFIEMFITAALIVAVLMLAAEKHQVTPFAPVSSFYNVACKGRMLTYVP